MVIEGIADLPLHEGHVPDYLLRRMKMLGSLIAKYIVELYGPEELLRRFSNPLWFQAFNNVIGMDWDSSGSTTITLYVLKTVFQPEKFHEYNVAVIGGKGRDARNLQQEVVRLNKDIDTDKLIETSRLAAKIDSTGLQDGYTLYIHCLALTNSGKMLIIQQGMNLDLKIARRYHILVDGAQILSCEKDPHSGVASKAITSALNLVDEGSQNARRAILEIVESTPPDSLVQDLYHVNRILKNLPDIRVFSSNNLFESNQVELSKKIQNCPIYYKPVTNVKKVAQAAETIKRESPGNFKELLLIKGIGPETIRAIALIADLIYGYEPSLKDPTTYLFDPFLYAYAHGGKDGVPYRIKVHEIDKTIEFFTRLIDEVKTGNKEKEVMLRNLAKFVSRFKGKLDSSSSYFF
ncbi:MAG: DUF763 domain-containing protein [Desulfurococcaceae archaeon]